jgi:hypothetical protein
MGAYTQGKVADPVCGMEVSPLVAISLLSYMGVLGPWGFYALILLCPLLHVLMMLKQHEG